MCLILTQSTPGNANSYVNHFKNTFELGNEFFEAQNDAELTLDYTLGMVSKSRVWLASRKGMQSERAPSSQKQRSASGPSGLST